MQLVSSRFIDDVDDATACISKLRREVAGLYLNSWVASTEGKMAKELESSVGGAEGTPSRSTSLEPALPPFTLNCIPVNVELTVPVTPGTRSTRLNGFL